MRKGRVSAGSAIVVALFFVAPVVTFADGPCPVPGTHPATSADVVLMLAAHILDARIGMCWDPKGSVGADVGQAKQDLLPRYQPGGDSMKCGANIVTEGITRLNPNFAVRLANMLKNAEAATGSKFGINSAYRCPEAQLSANPNGYGGNPYGSPHVRGLAVDLIYPGGGTKYDCSSPGYQWVIAHSQKEFGIAQYDQIHNHVNGECNHIEDTTGATGLGSNGQPLTPPQNSPSAALSNMLRNFLGQDQQPPPQQQTPQPQPQQAVSPTQNPYNYTPQPTNNPASPSQSSSPISSPVGTSNTNTNAVDNQNQNTNNSQNNVSSGSSDTNKPAVTVGPSAIDQINAIAYPSSTPPTGGQPVGAPVGISADLVDAVQIHGTPSTSPAAIAVNTTQGPAPIQTFTTQDLSQAPTQAYAVNPQTTFAMRILEDLKQKLLWALSYLKPFGGRVNGVPPNTQIASME